LREESGNGDLASVKTLISTHFPSLQTPRILSVSRLGKNVRQTGVRKLLVRFPSESEPNPILHSAKSLRQSANNYIRQHVFINADLSREEAKLAYEKRVNRRSRGEGRAVASGGTGVSDEAGHEAMDSGVTPASTNVPTRSASSAALCPNAAEFVPPMSKANPVVSTAPPNPSVSPSDSSSGRPAS
jgi:hypothetical protein